MKKFAFILCLIFVVSASFLTENVSSQDKLFLRVDSLKTGSDSIKTVSLGGLYDAVEIAFVGGASGDSIAIRDMYYSATQVATAKVFNLTTNAMVDTIFVPANTVVRVQIPWEVILGLQMRRTAPTMIADRRTDWYLRAKRLF